MIEVEHIRENKETVTERSVYYVEAINDEEYLLYQISLHPESYDGNTNGILKELTRAFGIPLSGYGSNLREYTYGGELVEKGQADYQRKGDDIEVGMLFDTPLIGTFDMYGAHGGVSIAANYERLPLAEYVMKRVARNYQYHWESSDYYSDVTEVN